MNLIEETLRGPLQNARPALGFRYCKCNEELFLSERPWHPGPDSKYGSQRDWDNVSPGRPQRPHYSPV